MVAVLRRAATRPLTARERGLLGPMVKESDNKAGLEVYRSVGDLGLNAVAHAAGMRRFLGVGALFEARITAADQARLFLRIDRLVPARHRAYARALLSGIVAGQRWGIAPIARARHFAAFFKGGWRKGLVHQAALLERRGRRIALAVLTSGEPTVAYGQATLAGVASRVLGPMTRIAVIHHLAQPFLGHAGPAAGRCRRALRDAAGARRPRRARVARRRAGGVGPGAGGRGRAAARGGRARDPGAGRLPRRPAAVTRARRGEPAAAAPARDLGADRGARPRRSRARRDPGRRPRAALERGRLRAAAGRRRGAANGREAAARRASASAASRGACSSIRRSTKTRWTAGTRSGATCWARPG